MNKIIPIHEPVFIGKEYEYLKACIKDGWVSTSGKFINQFENKISKITKSKYSIAINNCTSSLFLSLKVSGVMPMDEIIISSITFISPVNTILYNQCSPIFMDCDEYLNIKNEKTIQFINNETFTKKINNKVFTYNKSTKRRISAIIIVHTFGNPADIYSLISICKDKNIKIIEDAAESIGSYIKIKDKKKHLGSIGDIGCISFNGNKLITSGGGGVILTNNKKIYNKIHHISTQSKIDFKNFIHDEIGYNMRITNLQAALGLAQIEKLPTFLKRKKQIHQLYKKSFQANPSFEILSGNIGVSNNWINILKFDQKKITKKYIFDIFQKNLIQARSIWLPNHLQKFLQKYQQYKIEKSKTIFESSLCLPSSYSLKDSNIYKISNLLNNINS